MGFSSLILSQVSTGTCESLSIASVCFCLSLCFSVLLYGITFTYSLPASSFSTVLGLSCGMWDLVPQSGVTPGPPALEVWSLSHWTTREVLLCLFLV